MWLAVLLVLAGSLVIAGCSRHRVKPQAPTALEAAPVEPTPGKPAAAPQPASPSPPGLDTPAPTVAAAGTADEKNVATESSAGSATAPPEAVSPDRVATASSRPVPDTSPDVVLSPTAVANVYSAAPPGGQGTGPSPGTDRPSPRAARPPSATPDPVPEPPAPPPESEPGTPSGPAERHAHGLHLSIATSNPTPAVGEIVLVDVEIATDAPVVDAPFRLQYDPAVLEFVDAAPGEFLARGMSSVVFLVDAAGRHGEIAIAIGRTERGTGAEGTGLLCRIRLQASAPGPSEIVLLDPRAWEIDGSRLDVVVTGSRVVVH
jgi:hypothetical protein